MLQSNEVKLETVISRESYPNSLFCESCEIYMTITEIEANFSENEVILRGECYMPYCENTGVGCVEPTETSERVPIEIN